MFISEIRYNGIILGFDNLFNQVKEVEGRKTVEPRGLATNMKGDRGMKRMGKILAVLLSGIVTVGGILIPETAASAAAIHTVSGCGGQEQGHVVMDKYTGKVKNEVDDHILGYTITDTGLYNTVTHQQFIQGYFYNASNKYHIMDMEGTEIVVQDLEGNYLFEMADADYSEIEELVLPPRTKVKFNANVYSPQVVKYDLSKIEAFVVCNFSYQECVGDGCATCGGPVTNEFDTNDKSVTGVSEGMKLCTSCGGNGKCKRCDGKGHYVGFNGNSKDCGLCRKRPGVCITCGGEGEVPIPKPVTRSRSYSADDYDTDDFDDDWEIQYECNKCNGTGECSNCGGKRTKYGKTCFSCMGDGKCYKCGGNKYISY